MTTSAEARDARLRSLMVRAQDGDAGAYRELLAAVAGLLRAFFRRRMTRLPDEIEDLVQETLLAVHNQRHTYDPERPVTAWLFAIARYKLIDLLRRRSRQELLTDALDEVDETLLAAEEPPAEARRDLARLLERLPDKQRLPILYVKIEALSVEEAARRTGLSESAVKVGIHRGLKALAALIRRQA